jgi:hypothetical protein
MHEGSMVVDGRKTDPELIVGKRQTDFLQAAIKYRQAVKKCSLKGVVFRSGRRWWGDSTMRQGRKIIS